MSFGQQGQVRYALIVDDAQATQKMTAFKNQLNSLGTPTGQVTKNMGALNSAFQNASGGLTKTNTLFGQTGPQVASISTKIKDATSKFAGFATGMAATTSGVLQLAAGFRDYGDAQIAVDRQTRKLSLAHEAVTKATDKLNQLINKGTKSGKEYEQAQLDVTQAQQNLSVQTDLLGEAQERMFDSQTQFVASVIPTTLGAVGTLGSAYKDLGLNTGKLTEKFKTLPASLGMSTKGFLGMSTAIGAAAFAAAGFFETLQQGTKVKELVTLANLPNATAEDAQKSIDALKNFRDSWQSIITRGFQTTLLGNALFGPDVTGEVLKSLESLKSRIEAEEPLKKLMDAITKSNIATGQKNAIIAQIKELENMYANENNWKAGYGATADQVAANTRKIISLGIEKLKNLIAAGTFDTQFSSVATGLTGKMREAFIKANPGAEFTGMTKMFAIDPKPISAGIDTIGNRYKNLMDTSHMVMRKMVEDSQFIKKMNELAWGAPATSRFSNFKLVGSKAYDEIAAKAEEARKKVEEFNKNIAQGVKDFSVGFKIKDNAEKIAKDIRDNIDKATRKKIDLKLQFRADKAAGLKDFNDALKTAATLDEKTADGIVKGVIKTIDENFKGKKGTFSGLRSQLETTMKDPNTVALLNQTLMKGDYTASGNKIGEQLGTGTAAAFRDALNKKLFPQKGTKLGPLVSQKGGFISDEEFKSLQITLPPPITTDFDVGIKAAQDKVTGTSGLVQAINNAKPKITIDNKKALVMIDTVKLKWQQAVKQIASNKPKITIDNKGAINQLDSVMKRLNQIDGFTAHATVNVKATGSGLQFVQHGYHGVVNRPTLFVAGEAGSERVDVSPLGGGGKGGSGSSGGGSGSGQPVTIIIPITIQGNDIIQTKEIVRKVEIELGKHFRRVHG